ncbi:hypothetical protein FRC14_001082 [Serendipita sp. 396]|nr:hypothetical protein FRC14_001082 [Serendipita sp. 396]KAG8785797.1 hypothetical protein FRC15_000682 [Serendipita sp. 397]KAG8801318.1 hypothetical protein FRC16_000745 [Serendipita sp. 398]KAG8818067.1 hypothetical protein FRC19_010900 [Serendipita sp. 401]KAG8852087.1 hypothetical protein FRB91_007024 [Serendipita sp. 411]KAG8870052.1 hypothetical protein FRC20_000447 [Serendipita sp. 405]
MSALIFWNAVTKSAGLTTLSFYLVFLPLTLATLSQSAFLLLSLFLTLQSIIHATLYLTLPTLNFSSGRTLSLPSFLPFLQIPALPFLLILVFNIFSSLSSVPSYVMTLASWWGTLLRYSSPIMAGIEALASLIVIQSAGMMSKELAGRSEGYQFGLLIASASAYVAAFAWFFLSFVDAASTPLTAMLFGCALTSLLFLTGIGFNMRRTNVVESSGVALILAYNIWQCTDDSYAANYNWTHIGGQYGPLVENLVPHLETMFKFITQSLPRPLIAALIFRLTILQIASQIVAKMGDDGWEDDDVGLGWESRPSSRLTNLVLAYSQTIFIAVYSHLLLIDHNVDVYWRWANVFFILLIWSVELLVWGTDEEDQHWKMD